MKTWKGFDPVLIIFIVVLFTILLIAANTELRT